MNRTELKTFMEDLFQVWKDGDESRVLDFYDKDVKAYSDFKPITLEDILNRFKFAQDKFLELDHGVQDMLIDETEGKIAIRMKQNHIVKANPSERVACEVISLYKVTNYKITEIWMSFYPNVDYLNNQS
jgi:hypothetical protein